MQEILKRIDIAYESLLLGFAPCEENAGLFEAELYDGGEDYRFFYLGGQLQSIQTQHLIFPELSHA